MFLFDVERTIKKINLKDVQNENIQKLLKLFGFHLLKTSFKKKKKKI